MPGYDSVDSGNRAAYGMRSQLLFARGQSIDAMLGQSYNTNETPFPNSRKLGNNYRTIGRVGLNYKPFTFSYRFALDKNNLNASRNEIWTVYNNPSLQLSAAYLSIQNSPYVSDSEEVIGSGKIQLIDEWSLYGNARRDILNNAMVSTTSGLIYENECFSVLTQMQRIYTRDEYRTCKRIFDTPRI